MAAMIPEGIDQFATSMWGERSVLKILETGLLPHEKWIVWSEPKTMKPRSDFVVWAEGFGFLVIEVKDWKLETIRSMNPDSCVIDGERSPLPNPLEQARRYALEYKEAFERASLLCRTTGKYRGKTKFPIGYCVVLTRITEQDAEAPELLDLLSDERYLLLDVLRKKLELPNGHEALEASLRKGFNGFYFSSDSLEAEELPTLRKIMFPQVVLRETSLSQASSFRSSSHTSKAVISLQSRGTESDLSLGPVPRLLEKVEKKLQPSSGTVPRSSDWIDLTRYSTAATASSQHGHSFLQIPRISLHYSRLFQRSQHTRRRLRSTNVAVLTLFLLVAGAYVLTSATVQGRRDNHPARLSPTVNGSAARSRTTPRIARSQKVDPARLPQQELR